MNEPSPLLSVCVPTYQHGAFIEQTMRGILMQAVEFEVEVLIGDDGSNDQTPHLVRAFVAAYAPHWRTYLHPHNLGPHKPAELGGKNNVMFLFTQCRGKYIALCEGDDYWTDPLKLQKQVDFLEANPDFALCHHQTQVIYEDGSPPHNFNSPDQAQESTLADLLTDRWFVATASSVFRNVHYPFPDWFLAAASGDLGIFVIAARQGRIRYLTDTMAVYRKHRGGMTNLHTTHNEWFLRNRLAMYQAIDAYCDYTHHETLLSTFQKYEAALESLGGKL